MRTFLTLLICLIFIKNSLQWKIIKLFEKSTTHHPTAMHSKATLKNGFDIEKNNDIFNKSPPYQSSFSKSKESFKKIDQC